jgi:hypothetical protein
MRIEDETGSRRVKFAMVKVVAVKPLGAHRLHIAFSDGSAGDHDFSELVAEPGPMVEPLRDPGYFARVFVEMGVPTWPKGFDIDALNLHMIMAAAGELSRDAAE